MGFKRYAQWQKKQPKGTMNKAEQAYFQYLRLLKQAGQIEWHGPFEGTTLHLGPNTSLTMDVEVVGLDGVIELHDVKGRKMKKRSDGSSYESYYCTEDAKLKIKLAAQSRPYRFKIVWQSKDGSWNEETIRGQI